ncbi:MAG: MBL fold metallo-hydrolase [Gammaproteobacteria bacterium]|nr:MBL fold metallo-hydrolase [Gammaproteobacteria bacterium]
MLTASFAAEKSDPHAGESEHGYTREEVDHDYGTEAGRVYYPEIAVDTDDAPSFAIPEEVGEEVPLKVYEVVPGTWMFYGNIAEVDENNRGSNGNAGFVVTDDGVVVIDALGTPKLGKRLIATVRSVTDQPIRYLIVTHNHPDHAYGAIAFRELPGVIIIGHKGTLKYINSDRIEHSVTYRRTFIDPDMKGFKAVTPDVLVNDTVFAKYTFSLGGRTFDVYNTGAHHSYGDLVIHQVEDNIVWISDLAFNNRVTFMSDGSSKAAIAAQKWVLEKFADARLMIPGHGSAQTKPFPMVSWTLRYMQTLRDRTRAALDDGVDLQDAVDSIEFDDWKKVRLYGLNHRANVGFVYREMEIQAFE